MFVLLAAAGAVQAGGDVAKGQELSIDCDDFTSPVSLPMKTKSC